MADLTPPAIVAELDNYIVGQEAAKRALAIALRERDRRRKLPPRLRREISPKNILVIGPTGVGKTELARRLARFASAPFVKTEATQYTEVGYVGRDAESIIRELADASVSMVHQERLTTVREEAEKLADERLLGYLVESGRQQAETETKPTPAQKGQITRKRRAMARQLAEHKLEEKVIEIEVEGDESYGSPLDFASGLGSDDIHEQFQEFMNSVNLSRKRSRRLPVREARRVLIEQEANKLIDFDDVVETALRRVEETGIVFIDEIDKIAGRSSDYGGDVSGEGVQRDLLPIVEGAAVGTRYGMVSTDHVLFIASGAFNRSRPSDLLPELQGRFPIRVEVHELSETDFVRILTEPDNALTLQHRELLKTENVTLEFTEDGIQEIAATAARLNGQAENLGARRLHGVMEKVLEEVSFRAAEFSGQEVVVDAEYVRTRMATVPFTDDIGRYIL